MKMAIVGRAFYTDESVVHHHFPVVDHHTSPVQDIPLKPLLLKAIKTTESDEKPKTKHRKMSFTITFELLTTNFGHNYCRRWKATLTLQQRNLLTAGNSIKTLQS